MATNNAVNLSGSGAVKYDGVGTFSAVAVPLTVPNEGTGNSSLTTYAVLTGGTTTTGNVQSIASVGSATEVLTSNGSSSLPTFQAPSGGATFTYTWTSNFFSPADSTTYYLINNGVPTTTHASASYRYYLVNTGTITKAFGLARVATTLGTSENVTIFIRLNDSSNTDITTTSQWTSTNNTFSNTALNLSVSAGDYIELGFTTPAWVTNPTNVYVSCAIYGIY